jgi:hypothetical protein
MTTRTPSRLDRRGCRCAFDALVLGGLGDLFDQADLPT